MYEVNPVEYHVFYHVLFKHFIENEIKPKVSLISRSLNSPAIWDEKTKDEGCLALKIFGGVIENPRYFYKIKSEHKISGSNIPLNAEALGKALSYLGYRVKTDNQEERKRLYTSQTAHDRWQKFVDDYRNVIEQIRQAEDSIQKNKITKRYLGLIHRKDQPQKRDHLLPSPRFYALNGKYSGVQIQGSFEPEKIDLELFTGSQNNLTGILVMHYKADGDHPEQSVEFHVSGKYFADMHVTLIYWNPDISVNQNGVIRLTQSGNKKELNGNFWGYYDPVPISRGVCEGTIKLSRIQ